MNDETPPSQLANEAPNPPHEGEVAPKVTREPVSSREWFAIVAIICLIIAMFVFMHGEKL